MRSSLVIAALLLAVGCSGSGDDGNPGGAGGSGGTGGTGGGQAGSGGGGGEAGSGGTGGAEVPPDVDTGWDTTPPASIGDAMPEGTRPESCGSEHGFFAAVRGWAVAPGGTPLEGAKAQLCIHYSPNNGYICLQPAVADADGVYTVTLPEEYRCVDQVAMRVLLSKSGRATSYCLLDTSAGPAVRLDQPSVVPMATPAIELPPEGDADASRPVKFDDGLVLDVTPSLFYSGTGVSYDRFGGRRIPTNAEGLCGEAMNMDGLYAFYPEGQISAPGFGVHLPNKNDYPAGATVELFVLGGLDCDLLDGTAVPEGTWGKFGEAIVSEDGTTIDSTDGSGLPCFTWLGYRLKD